MLTVRLELAFTFTVPVHVIDLRYKARFVEKRIENVVQIDRHELKKAALFHRRNRVRCALVYHKSKKFMSFAGFYSPLT